MAELLEPGVEVTQTFITSSPTIVTPTLLPCIVGLCRQIVDVLVPSASGSVEINTQARVSLPGSFTADAATGLPLAYTGLDGDSLVVSINNSPDVTVTFSGTSLSPAQVVSQINDAFALADITSARAEVVGDDTFRLVTIGEGPFETIEIMTGTDASVLTAFNLVIGHIFAGYTSYGPDRLLVTEPEFPDPRGNLEDLVFEAATLRAFLSLGSGTSLRELSRTESFLRKGGVGDAASIEGTVALSTLALYGGGGDLDGKRLNVKIDGAAAVVVNLGTPTDAVHLLQTINAALDGIYATNGVSGLVLTSRTTGYASEIELVDDGTPALDAKGDLGFVVANSYDQGTSGVLVLDDGNGDVFSPLVKVLGENFNDTPTVAEAEGYVDLTGVGVLAALNGTSLTLRVNGYQSQKYTFSGAPVSAAAVATALTTFFGPMGLVATIAVGNLLHLETDPSFPLGEEATIEVLSGDAAGVLGLAPILTGTIDLTTISPTPAALNTKKLKISVGGVAAEYTFVAVAAAADVVTELNGDPGFSAIAVASLFTGNKLRIRAKSGGKGISLTIEDPSSSDASPYVGLTVGQTAEFYRFTGVPYKPLSGDDLYVDGSLVGKIIQVGVGGDNAVLKLNKQLTITENLGDHFTIQAKGLASSSPTRPTPEMVVDLNGSVVIKHDLLRDTDGNVTPTSQSLVYLSYRAIRQDVTAMADNPALLRFSSVEEVESLIGPISTANPLALGAYLALLNSPGSQITALGVDETSADATFGTSDAFTRAFELLESQEVYAIAPLTHDETVAAILSAHVTALSAPAQKAERIGYVCLPVPTKRLDGLVASGQGNTVGSGGLTFDTGVAGLPQLLLAAGINPVGTIPVSAGVFLDIASDSKNYSISSISGSVVTIRTSFLSGENDDDFYSTSDLNDTPLQPALINENFSVKVRGASLTLPNGTRDKAGVVTTVAATSAGFDNRRLYNIFPDRYAASINGLEQVIEGFYECAVRAGMRGKYLPSQSFTNFPQVGLTRVFGSNDTFSRSQLNEIAGGGTDIVVQLSSGAPLISRFAISTDTTSVETRTDSITSAIDYSAKLLRLALQGYIGKFNITSNFIDSLGNVVSSMLEFLVNTGIIAEGSLVEIIQDPSAPDTLLVTVRLKPLYPCNYIKLTIEV